MTTTELDLFTPYQAHSETSKAAAGSIAGRSGTLRRKVFNWIAKCGPLGSTDHETQAALSMDGSTQRPRRVKLADMGLIEQHGTRPTPSGRQAAVWRLTAKGKVAGV